MKLVIAFISLLLISTTYTYSDDKETSTEEKIYTKTEFQNAVTKEVEKRLNRSSRSALIEFSKELMAKEEALNLKDLEIEKKAEQVKLNMKHFEQRLTEFQKEQNKILGCLDAADKDRQRRVSHMVDVISGMKPNIAAEVLSVQDSGISVQILERLDPTKVSKIFNVMDKEISARLQKQFLNMKK